MNMRKAFAITLSAALILTVGITMLNAEETPAADVTLEAKYPRLSFGPLRTAVLVEMTGDTILTSDTIILTTKEVSDEIAKAPTTVRSQFADYQFFMLEQLAIHKILAKEASEWAAATKPANAPAGDELINLYLKSKVDSVTVTDQEASKFFTENPELFGTAKFDSVKDHLKKFLEGEKKQAMLAEHIGLISTRHKIRISDDWAGKQYSRWLTNPVEKAIGAKRPVLVMFGTKDCAPCQQMVPILKALETQHKDKLSILNIDLNQHHVLGAYHDASATPLTLIFDARGVEVFRQTGFIGKTELDRELAKSAIK